MNHQRSKGFTIVELLIVIVVVAILAAISVVAYAGIQNRTHDSVVKQDLANIRKSLELAKVDLGHYPLSRAEFPTNAKISRQSYDITANNVYYAADETTDSYALGVRSKSGRGFIMTSRELQEDVTVNGQQTALAIGLGWADTTYRSQCHAYSSANNTSTWSTVCPL